MFIKRRPEFAYLFGEVLNKATPFLLLPYLTHRLGAVNFADFAIYEVIFALFFLMINFGQDSLVIKSYSRYGPRLYCGLLKNICFVQLTIFTIIVLMLFSLGKKQLYLVIICFAAYMSVLLNLLLCDLQAKQKIRDYLVFQSVGVIVGGLSTIVLIEMYSGFAYLRFVGIGIGAFVSIYLAKEYIKKIASLCRRPLSSKYFKYQFFIGAPLLIHHLSYFSRSKFDRVIVSEFYSSYDLAIYAVAGQLALLLPIIYISITKALVPKWFSRVKAKTFVLDDFFKSIAPAYAIFILMLFTIILMPDKFLTHVFGEEFMNMKPLILAGFLSSIILPINLFFTNIALYFDKSILIIISSIMGSAISLVAVYILSSHHQPLQYLLLSGILYSLVSTIVIVFGMFPELKRIGLLND